MDGIDKGIYGVLDADRQNQAAGSLGALGVTGLWHGQAPKGEATPFLRFQQMSAPVSSSMGAGPSIVECVYLVLCVDDGDDQLRAGAIARRIKELLHKQPIDCSPSSHMQTLWDRALDLPEHVDGRQLQNVGANYRVWVYE